VLIHVQHVSAHTKVALQVLLLLLLQKHKRLPELTMALLDLGAMSL
jgi:hypothetical protein